VTKETAGLTEHWKQNLSLPEESFQCYKRSQRRNGHVEGRKVKADVWDGYLLSFLHNKCPTHSMLREH